MLSIEDIKKLREETGAGPVDIKKALEESGGDFSKAKELLKAKVKKTADKKSTRETSAGLVKSYIHQNGRTGVLLDIRCETDFVSSSDTFQKLANEICLQIAAMSPLYVSDKEIPEDVLIEETKKYEDEIKSSGKPANIMTQILEGKLNKYKQEVCLMSQAWVKDDSKTIKSIVEDAVAKTGENIEIKRFSRFEI